MLWDEERFNMIKETAKITYLDGLKKYPNKDFNITFTVSRKNEKDIYLIAVLQQDEELGSFVELFPVDSNEETRAWVTHDEEIGSFNIEL